MLGIYEKAINNRFSWEEKLSLAKEAGFDFVEFSVDESSARLERLDWSAEKAWELRAIAEKEGMPFQTMALSGLRKFPYGCADENARKTGVAMTKKAIVLARRLGIRTIQLAGYDVYYEKPAPDSESLFLRSLAEVLAFAEERSVMLAFETMDTEFMSTITRYLRLAAHTPSPWLSVYPDFGNLWQWSAGAVAAEIAKGKGDIVAFHFKDTKPGVFRDVDWGAGTVDFVACLRAADAIGFKGPVVMETWSRNDPAQTYTQCLGELKDARAFYEAQRRAANDVRRP